MLKPMPKQRLFGVPGRLPFVGETADPWIFTVLATLAVTAGLATAFAGEVFPHDKDARGHVIQLAAGLLVLLGAYFTAVNIRETRAHQAFERLHKVLEQLGSPSEPVRLGAISLLESIAVERLDLPSGSATEEVTAARNHAVVTALQAVAAEEEGAPGESARATLRRLQAYGFVLDRDG